MLMIYTGRHEIALLPYEQFPNQQLCEAWKEQESIALHIPTTCVKDKDYEL